jgi:hypothetical protein
MALALDLLRKLLTKLFFLRLLPYLLRGGAGEDDAVRTESGDGLWAMHFAPADEFHRRPQVPVLQ